MNRVLRIIGLMCVVIMTWNAGCSVKQKDRLIPPLIDGLAQIPMPGDILENLPRSCCMIVYGSGGLSDEYRTTVDGITFTVGVHRTKDGQYRVDYVDTSDSLFVTPEGVRCGDTLASLSTHTTHSLVRPPGAAAFVSLPSGWCAAFDSYYLDTDMGFIDIEVTDESRVILLFRD